MNTERKAKAMPKLSISEASRQWGVSRRTLQRKVQDGTLSCAPGPGRAKTLDTSELVRVFGEPSAHVRPEHDTGHSHTLSHAHVQLIEQLKNENELLRKELDRAHGREHALLTHQTKSWWQKLFG